MLTASRCGLPAEDMGQWSMTASAKLLRIARWGTPVCAVVEYARRAFTSRSNCDEALQQSRMPR